MLADTHSTGWIYVMRLSIICFQTPKNTNCQMLTVNDVLTYIVVICFLYYQNCNFFKPLPAGFFVSVAGGCLYVLSVSMPLSVEGIHKFFTYNFFSFIPYIHQQSKIFDTDSQMWRNQQCLSCYIYTWPVDYHLV